MMVKTSKGIQIKDFFGIEGSDWIGVLTLDYSAGEKQPRLGHQLYHFVHRAAKNALAKLPIFSEICHVNDLVYHLNSCLYSLSKLVR